MQFYTVRGYSLLTENEEKLTPSLEDYMEMIYRAADSGQEIKVKNLAANLHVKPSSASKMIVRLAQKGYLNYERYGNVTLTEKGKEIGAYLLWRHKVISSFLKLISQGENETSFIEGELAEHSFTPETVHKIERLCLFFIQNTDIDQRFQQYLKNI